MPRQKIKLSTGTLKENSEKFKDDNKLEYGEIVLEGEENPGEGPIRIKCGDGVHDYEDLPYTAGSDEDQNAVMKRLTIETYELKKTLRSVVCFCCIVGLLLILACGSLIFIQSRHIKHLDERITKLETAVFAEHKVEESEEEVKTEDKEESEEEDESDIIDEYEDEEDIDFDDQ